MSQISPSVLKSLSTLVPDSLNYVCLCEYGNVQWYMALGQKSFYFISDNLMSYKDPPIPYSKIECCKLCIKKKTLMQIRLKPPKKGGVFGKSSDPSVLLDNALAKTYGTFLNIYNQDRKAAVDSFKCYW
mmetsp:Transcript_24004/g.36885  ORF Transcript_24004/g.36885 Transcript_24004/m.36885 type:complete len:129 (+) Transcript_24004:2-388(+)